MAAIADEAGVPKPNLHYYFGSKLDLYRAVLDRVLHDWLDPTEVFVADAQPRAAAALIPAVTRSLISDDSNSAMAPATPVA